jgi:hypothetical protein
VATGGQFQSDAHRNCAPVSARSAPRALDCLHGGDNRPFAPNAIFGQETRAPLADQRTDRTRGHWRMTVMGSGRPGGGQALVAARK